ncbi:MAG: DUF1289 domain-containing protein [Pseudomonas sp.]
MYSKCVPRDAAGRVASPCVSLCRIHGDSEMCQGCGRMRKEIIIWRDANDDTRLRIIAQAEARQGRGRL